MLKKLESAIISGLDFIAKQQQPDGSFVSFSSSHAADFSKSLPYRTTFVPALILACLSAIDGTKSQRIRQPLAQFLMSQQSPEGSFNYWANAAPEKATYPYPDDLDDTFCALTALTLHDPACADAEMLARAVKLLLATETKVGGPYRTWLVSPNSDKVWLDVDLAVNSNVAYFLSLVGQPLPSLVGLMEQAITARKFESPYYPSAYPLIYYLARAYQGPKTGQLLKAIQELLATDQPTSLQDALCLTALMRLDPKGSHGQVVRRLLAAQQADGSWPAEAFCLDPARDGKVFYNGSSALTTALAVEALNLYSKAESITTLSTSGPRSQADKQFQRRVIAVAKQYCRSLPKDLRKPTLKSLMAIDKSPNGPEIMVLPMSYNHSLLHPLPPDFKDLLVKLGTANLWGWLAYTIYDDFLDEEGQPGLLSVANVALRRSLLDFNQALSKHLPFQDFVRQTFDTIDGANAWELAHCRFEHQADKIFIKKLPDYGDLIKLAERSLGHALPALGVLVSKGVKLESSGFQKMQQALTHYLIARQLNDDAHDWQDDLKNGQITYVVGRILADKQVASGQHNLEALLPDLQQQFWHHSLPGICQEMQRQVNLSRQALKASKMLKPDNIISKLLDGIESSVQETLTAQKEARSFLRHYGRPSQGVLS